jgi:uncharacterized protein (TIGR02099 family)
MHILPRFPRLAALSVPPWLRRSLRITIWGLIGLYFALGLLVLVLRHFVLPGIADYRDDIERNLSEALGQPVAIRAIDARWRRLWPSLRIHGLEIRDAQGRPALGFEEVEADLAWSSLWHLAPHFARLEIKAPRLDLRRTADGRLFVAGLKIETEATPDAGFAEWLLAQDRIVIREAVVTWHDEMRRAPPLALRNLNFDLRNRGSRHRFGLTAEPPRELAARIDVRGDFSGDDIESLRKGQGQAYAELDYANLSGWHAWVDYPVELPRGQGGLRLWLEFERQALSGVTADVRLGRTQVRVAPELPMLDMDFLDGRLAARRDGEGFLLQTRRLALATHDGIRIEPTDIDFRWQPGSGERAARGEANANVLDLGGMAALAAYLPFDAGIREKIVALGPQGRVRELQAAWAGDFDALASYRLKSRFENLGLNAQGNIPGFFGLDGTIEGNEKGGMVSLATRAATIELPAVFEQPAIILASLDARADWSLRDGAVDVRLQEARFDNADAAGEASGRYRGSGDGPGEIDLSAKLTRADGGSVWRYMPLVVNERVRSWLHDSIIGGAATATLRLKGDLKRFPFVDGSGIFEVKGPFQGATLRYVEGWPAFENVTGDLLFAGARMVIRAQRASLWGVQLNDVKAEIADLDKPEVPMVITGGARGPTADFLRFIDSSPVGGYIDNVTEGMKAAGAGELRLRLELPLHDLDSTRVDGHYRFLANQLVYHPDLPSIADINGELHFTQAGLDAKKIRATMLGAPLVVDVLTEDGRVALQAAGSANMAALRQQYGHPALEHLTGSTPWSGVIRVKKRSAELRIESPLLGISSSLPEPFNKTAGDVMPLVFERKALSEPLARGRRSAAEKVPGERDLMEVSLGDALHAQIIRRHGDEGVAVERGVVSIGTREAKLPESGVLLAVRAPRVDVDLWRRVAAGGGTGGSGGGLTVGQIDMRTDELHGLGRSLHALQLVGRQEGDTWKLDVKAAEGAGRIEWTSRGNEDRLSARLARLDIPDGGSATSGQPATDPTERLPAIDVVVDQLSWHGRALGRLQVQAENASGIWGAGFQIRNEDGEIEGTSSWHEPGTGVPSASALDFRLTTRNIENMLERLGYPDAVRRGRATLVGQLYWSGPPTRIDYPSLGGNLTLEAARGQFKKLEPGVGRLLGVLSLQSLPRRISLDFRDIFSEGFAFESIEGKVVVSRGIMETSEFEIAGPAAKVLMNGTVNIVNETQDLKVRVQPTIGETVATGVLLVNPVVGATAWLMNRVFGNPLDKAFAFDYTVTGSWADPRVEKVAVQGPSAALEFGGAITP